MRDPSGRKLDDGQRQSALALAVAGLLGQVGCLTTLVIVAALVVGLWLDRTLDSRPVFTLILLAGSVPVTIYLMVRVVLGGMARLQEAAGVGKPPGATEEEQRGREP